jgi:flavin-dependent dehydrogenase
VALGLQKSDVLIVGGGPAGLSCGIELALSGLKVIINEQRSFPIDKACGEGIMPDGVAHLHRLGVFQHLDPSQMRPFSGVCFINQRGTKAFASFGSLQGLGLRRLTLSQALYSRACQFSNLTILSKNSVLGIKQTKTCMQALTDQGVIKARLIVGADGLRSSVRKWAKLEQKERAISRYGIRRHYKVKPWANHVEVYFGEGIEAYITPCSLDQTNVTLLWSKYEVTKPKEEKLGFSSLLRNFPDLMVHLEGADCMSKELAIGPFEQRSILPIANGIALVGDASGYLDAITGEGNSIAMAQSKALAKTVVRAIREEAKGIVSKKMLAPYLRAHRRIVRSYYRNTKLLLMLARKPALMHGMIEMAAKNTKVFSWLLQKAHGRYRV